jgi:hypothetical protein
MLHVEEILGLVLGIVCGCPDSFIPLACAECGDSLPFQELLPFLSVMYLFLPPFSTNYFSILPHLATLWGETKFHTHIKQIFCTLSTILYVLKGVTLKKYS